jgi:Holliday junction resolvase RusA-like endonuclease
MSTSDADALLMEALAKAEKGLEPSPYGELLVKFPISPVSIQSATARKDAQRALIVAELARFKFLLIGDVQMEVTWLCSAKARYESDSSPDVDNILKPLLDALCGPSGVLVDDCQVNAIGASCCSMRGPELVEVQIKHSPDDFISKEGLLFLDLGRALCVPITESLPGEALRLFVGAIENMMGLRGKLDALGADIDPRMTMIGPRIFHKSRVKHFACEAIAAFKSRKGLS